MFHVLHTEKDQPCGKCLAQKRKMLSSVIKIVKKYLKRNKGLDGDYHRLM